MALAQPQQPQEIGWTLGICGTRNNSYTGAVDSSPTTAKRCIEVIDAQTAVIGARTQLTRLRACQQYAAAKRQVQVAKAQSGQQWFSDFVCTVDCRGHEAGYRWAVDRAIQSTGDCPSAQGIPFEQGCWSRVRQLETLAFEAEYCPSQ